MTTSLFAAALRARWPLLVAVLLAAACAPFARSNRSGPTLVAANASVAVPAASENPPAVAPSATGKSFTDAIPCNACHTTEAWRAKGATGEHAKFDHSTTGFPLTGQHKHAACVACHKDSRPIKRACASCHDDAHRGRLSRSCDNCHVPAGWNVTRPLEIHRMTRFALTGMHALADCSECHRRASEHRWTGAPIECFACHENEYKRPDLRPIHVGNATSPPFPRDCSVCHRALAWAPAAVPAGLVAGTASPLRAAPPNHDVRFPISFGVHRTATCDDCHAQMALPRATQCIGCHAHNPVRITEQHRRPIATDGASCLGCHPGGARR